MTSHDLDRFFDGWNRHDVDALMTFMADDCVFETSSGPEACGTRHFVAGDRGVSEWRFTGTTPDGRKVEVDGCDVFTFVGDKISVKSSFFKNRTA